MRYRVRLTKSAKRSLATLPGRYRQRARRIVEGLAARPRPAGALELRNQPGVYRMRLNGWRVIWEIDDEAGTVLVFGIRLKTGPETYEDLESE